MILSLITATICLIFGIYKGVIRAKYDQGAFWLALACFNVLAYIIDKLQLWQTIN
jgi:hypothetical protein